MLEILRQKSQNISGQWWSYKFLPLGPSVKDRPVRLCCFRSTLYSQSPSSGIHQIRWYNALVLTSSRLIFIFAGDRITRSGGRSAAGNSDRLIPRDWWRPVGHVRGSRAINLMISIGAWSPIYRVSIIAYRRSSDQYRRGFGGRGRTWRTRLFSVETFFGHLFIVSFGFISTYKLEMYASVNCN